MRAAMAIMALCCVVVITTRSRAQDAQGPDLKQLLEETRKVVVKHYPKATFTLKKDSSISSREDSIHFEFNTRKYWIHEPTLGGSWQDAHEEIGPQRGGIYADMTLVRGDYGGQAVVPQSFDKRYFTLLLLAPYSSKLDHHLYVHLKYPRDVPSGFVQDFERLVNGFDKYLEPKGK